MPCLGYVFNTRAAQPQFAHTEVKEIVHGNGKRLLLGGTNRGNWLVPEGYLPVPQDEEPLRRWLRGNLLNWIIKALLPSSTVSAESK
jgi:hypothetical protein